jgi:hypothetical protein
MAIGIGSDNVESGLVLAIDFANPKSYPGSGTTVYDLSGNNYNGTLTNGPTFSTEYGGALVFDGTNDSINFNGQILTGTGDFTVSLWFRRTAGSGTVFGNYPAGNLQIFFGPVYLGMWLANSNLYSDGTSNFTPNPVNMVVQRSGTTTYLYVNNSLRMTASSNANIGTTSDFRIGTNTLGGEVYGGYFYSCAVYNRFLSTAEVAQNYNAEVRRFLPTIPVIDSSLILNLDAGNRLSFLNYGGSKCYYTTGGYAAGSRTDKLTYANDTTAAATTANPTTSGEGPAGASDGATKGYIAGRYPSTATTDKITFSSDTTAAQTTANLSSGRGYTGGGTNYQTKAYFSGGYDGIATTDRLIFSSDTTSASTSAALSVGRYSPTPVSQINTKCYMIGGGSGSTSILTTDILNFATDVKYTPSTAAAISSRRNPAGLTAVSARGYIAGGYTGAAATLFEKITFTTDVLSSMATPVLSQARWGPTGASEGSSKGYICGGYISGGVATADKLLFSSETCAAQTSANLTIGSYTPACNEEIYNTSSTSWVDLSGYYYNGTLTNGVSYNTADGIVSVYDGTNDFVSVNFPSIYDNFTVICAFKITSLSASAAGIVVWGADSTSQRRGMIYWNGGSGPTYRLYSSTFGSNIAGTTSLAINTWYYGTITLDSSGNARIYMNGVLENTGVNTLATPASNSMRIGSSKSAGEFFTGQIGLVRIYNRVLSATEILQNFNADRQRFGV